MKRGSGQGLYICTHIEPASREREASGKKVNGQEIDTVTILPMEKVRKGVREGKEKMDRGTRRETRGRGGSEHFSLWGQALGQYQLNKIHTNKLKYRYTHSYTTTDVHTL